MAMNVLNIPMKGSGDYLEAREFNTLISKINEMVGIINNQADTIDRLNEKIQDIQNKGVFNAALKK